MAPTLEVVICTYNRAFILEKNLERLLPLVAGLDISVLVVDNNSNDNTAECIERFRATYPNILRSVHESAQGLSHARNRGAAESKAQWIGYLDDDARVHADWPARALAVIASGDFDCFGGVFLPWHLFEGKPAWFPEESATNVGTQQHYGLLPADAYPCGGNFFCRRGLILAVGGFPVDLGMSGERCGYGEETYFCDRLREQGARIGFVPDLRIDHCVLPVKYTRAWHFDSAFAKGRDSWKITGKRAGLGKALGLALSLPFIAARDCVRGVAALRKAGGCTAESLAFYVGCRVWRRLGRIRGLF